MPTQYDQIPVSDGTASSLSRRAAGGVLNRGALERLANQAVSQELATMLCTSNVQAGERATF